MKSSSGLGLCTRVHVHNTHILFGLSKKRKKIGAGGIAQWEGGKERVERERGL